MHNSGPFICEGGSSEPTEPPGYGPVFCGQKLSHLLPKNFE